MTDSWYLPGDFWTLAWILALSPSVTTCLPSVLMRVSRLQLFPRRGCLSFKISVWGYPNTTGVIVVQKTSGPGKDSSLPELGHTSCWMTGRRAASETECETSTPICAQPSSLPLMCFPSHIRFLILLFLFAGQASPLLITHVFTRLQCYNYPPFASTFQKTWERCVSTCFAFGLNQSQIPLCFFWFCFNSP